MENKQDDQSGYSSFRKRGYRERSCYQQDRMFRLPRQYRREPTLTDDLIEAASYIWCKTNTWQDRAVQAGFVGLAVSGLGMGIYTLWNSL